MDDAHWDSVEAMLRWLIADKRARINRTVDALKSIGDPYSLPKPGDGLPDGWAWGPQTGAERERLLALEGLAFAADRLTKCEAAVRDGDLPKAVFLLDATGNCLQSALAHWVNSGAMRLGRYVKKRRSINAHNARTERKKELTAKNIASYRLNYIERHQTERGWLKSAAAHFNADPKTIRARLEKKKD